MAVQKIRWYVKAQLGVLLLPAGLCFFGEAVIRRGLDQLAASAQVAGAGGTVLAFNFLKAPGPWFWYGTLGLVLITAGVGLMIESGLLRGYPGRR
ncbi:MAG: hypothetical protein VKL23_01140 [Cyanobacteriota bacterium]|jgi:hypothetical protein|nr:hypothetical protein [Cyanobacteriota bacterium]